MAQDESKVDDNADAELNSIIKYWFDDLVDDMLKPFSDKQTKFWYGSGEEIDKEIKEKFHQILIDACIKKTAKYAKWQKTPKGILGLIILGDQFTRNIYRGSGDMFQCDEFCQSLVTADVTINKDDKVKDDFTKKYTNYKNFETLNELYSLTPAYILFYLSPLLHSENVETQERNMRLSDWLLDKLRYDYANEKVENRKNAFEKWIKSFESSYSFAKDHCDDIKRFGRFPHRNDLLKREWTDEERKFVQESGRMELISHKKK